MISLQLLVDNAVLTHKSLYQQKPLKLTAPHAITPMAAQYRIIGPMHGTGARAAARAVQLVPNIEQSRVQL